MRPFDDQSGDARILPAYLAIVLVQSHHSEAYRPKVSREMTNPVAFVSGGLSNPLDIGKMIGLHRERVDGGAKMRENHKPDAG